uniref:Uncharacterized protein n=1 Tax=Anguilla anguilla TaxID=7936 RepID=A0A0E9URY2_ANGAN
MFLWKHSWYASPTELTSTPTSCHISEGSERRWA